MILQNVILIAKILLILINKKDISIIKIQKDIIIIKVLERIKYDNDPPNSNFG